MGIVRQYFTALRFLVVITLALSVIYPVAIFAVGQVAMKNKSDGSFIKVNNQVVGSALIGQSFPGSEWFHSRPSGAGANGYDALSSAATNAGPNEPSLLQAVNARRASVAKEERIDPSQVPTDALTTSGSGLDPDISPAYAYVQAPRVAGTRHLDIAKVKALIHSQTSSRTFGILGEPRINVLQLNIALATLK
jgi:K+-transporting ATPase ATPase C chain